MQCVRTQSFDVVCICTIEDAFFRYKCALCWSNDTGCLMLLISTHGAQSGTRPQQGSHNIAVLSVPVTCKLHERHNFSTTTNSWVEVPPHSTCTGQPATTISESLRGKFSTCMHKTLLLQPATAVCSYGLPFLPKADA